MCAPICRSALRSRGLWSPLRPSCGGRGGLGSMCKLTRIASFVVRSLRRRQLRTAGSSRRVSRPGVAKVVVFGGEVRKLQIQVQPDRLLQYNLALEDVLRVAREATAIRGAGF